LQHAHEKRCPALGMLGAIRYNRLLLPSIGWRQDVLLIDKIGAEKR
jgi:hypothetical protein